MASSRKFFPDGLNLAVLIVFSAVVAWIVAIPTDAAPFYYAGKYPLSPYGIPGFYSPIYIAWLFYPLSSLSQESACRIASFVAYIAYGIVFWFLTGRKLLNTVILLLSAFPFFSAYYGNLEWMPVIGVLVPDWIAIWLFAVKPQIGFVAIALLIYWRMRDRGLLSAAILVAPLAAVLLLSVSLGWMHNTPLGSSWNISLWPIGIPVGLLLVAFAMKNKSRALGLAAGPFLSPYVGPMSWVAIYPAIARNIWLCLAVNAISWIVVITWRLTLLQNS